MDLTKEELIEYFRLAQTQQQQQIDILMMILKNASEGDAELLDFAHNKKNVFLSELTQEEFDSLVVDFRSYENDSD